MEYMIKDIQKFMTAGNALFTLKNAETGNRFTFKIKRAKSDDGKPRDFFFVSLLTGSDNYSNYSYMGIINKFKFTLTAKSKIGKESISYKAFNWLWNNRNAIPEKIEIWHEGRCGRCGRRLTVPESIESGFGPECINKI